MAQVFNLSTLEAERGGSLWIQGQLGLQSWSTTGFIATEKHCIKQIKWKKKKKTKKNEEIIRTINSITDVFKWCLLLFIISLYSVSIFATPFIKDISIYPSSSAPRIPINHLFFIFLSPQRTFGYRNCYSISVTLWTNACFI